MKNLYIVILVLISLGMGVVEVAMNGRGEVVSDTTQWLWGLVFIVLSILWAVDDAQSSHFEKPFDFDFLMYIFWPLAFPYYLLSTRKYEGIPLFLGFLMIGIGPWLAGLVAYVYGYSR